MSSSETECSYSPNKPFNTSIVCIYANQMNDVVETKPISLDFDSTWKNQLKRCVEPVSIWISFESGLCSFNVKERLNDLTKTLGWGVRLNNVWINYIWFAYVYRYFTFCFIHRFTSGVTGRKEIDPAVLWTDGCKTIGHAITILITRGKHYEPINGKSYWLHKIIVHYNLIHTLHLVSSCRAREWISSRIRHRRSRWVHQ